MKKVKKILKKKLLIVSPLLTALTFVPIISTEINHDNNITVNEKIEQIKNQIRQLPNYKKNESTYKNNELIKQLDRIKEQKKNNQTYEANLFAKLDFFYEVAKGIDLIAGGKYLNTNNEEKTAFMNGESNNFFTVPNQKGRVTTYMQSIVTGLSMKDLIDRFPNPMNAAKIDELELENIKKKLKNEHLRAEIITKINNSWPIPTNIYNTNTSKYPNDKNIGVQLDLTTLLNRVVLEESPDNVEAFTQKFNDIALYIDAMTEIKNNKPVNADIKEQWENARNNNNNIPWTTRREWLSTVSGWMKDYDNNKENFATKLEEATKKSKAIAIVLDNMQGDISNSADNLKADLLKEINAIDYKQTNGLQQEQKYDLLEKATQQIKEIGTNKYIPQNDKNILMQNIAKIFKINQFDNSNPQKSEEEKQKLINDITQKITETKKTTDAYTEIFKLIQLNNTNQPNGQNTIDTSLITYEEIRKIIEIVDQKDINSSDYVSFTNDYLKRAKTLAQIGQLRIASNHKPNTSVITDFNIMPKDHSDLDNKLANEYKRAQQIKDIENSNVKNELKDTLIEKTINWIQVNQENTIDTNVNFANELSKIKQMLPINEQINNRNEIGQNNIETILNRYIEEVENTTDFNQLETVKTNIENRLSLLDKIKNSSLKNQDKMILYTSVANLNTSDITLGDNSSQAVKNLDIIIDNINKLNDVNNINSIDNNTLENFKSQIANWSLLLTQEQITNAINYEIATNNNQSKLSLLINVATKNPTLENVIKEKIDAEILSVVFDHAQNNLEQVNKLTRIKTKLDLIDNINSKTFTLEDKNKLINYISNFNVDNDLDLDTNNENSKLSLLNLVLDYAQELIDDTALNNEQEAKYLKQLFTNEPNKTTVANFQRKVNLLKIIQNDQLIAKNDQDYFINQLDELNPSNDDFDSQFSIIENNYQEIELKRNVIVEINDQINQIINITKTNNIDEIIPFINKTKQIINKFKTSWEKAQQNKENSNLHLNNLRFYQEIRDNLKTDFNNLNFDLELSEKLKILESLSNFTKKQKNQIRTNLLSQNDNTLAKNLLDQIIVLDSTFGALKEQINQKTSVKESLDYQLENQEIKNNYDETLNQSQVIKNSLETLDFTHLNTNDIIEKINQSANITSELQSAQNNLDGRKTDLKNQINKALHLDKDQKNNFIEQINFLDKNTIDQGAKNQILNQALTQAKENLNLEIDKLNNLTQEEKIQFKEQILEADLNNDILDQNIANIYKQAQDLNKLRENLLNTLNQKIFLNQGQKNNFKEIIKTANETNEQQIINDINKLDQAMQNYQAISEIDHTDLNYLLADSNLKDNYDQANNLRKTIVDNNSEQNLNLVTIEEYIQNLENAKNNLNGLNKLNQSKKQAKDNIEQLNNLTKLQKNKLINLIDQSNDFTTIEQIENQANELNQKMLEMRNLINEKDNIQNDNNYIHATKNIKDNYDQAIDNSKVLLNNLNTVDNDNLLEISNVQNAINNINQTIDNLNGNSIFQAKKEAIDKIEKLNNITDKHKKELIALINQQDTLKNINQINDLTSLLDQNLNLINNQLNNENEIKNSLIYQAEEIETQKQYDSILDNAKNNLNQFLETDLNNINLSNLNEQINNLNTDYENLIQITNTLDGKRKFLVSNIEKMLYLTTEEKNQFNNQINSLNKNLSEAELNQIINQALEEAKLNIKTKINQLLDLNQIEKNEINQKIDLVSKNDQIWDQNIQEFYEEALTINNQKIALKEFLESKNFLNDAQKTTLRNEITLAHSNQIDQLKTKIQALDDVMKEYKAIEVVDKNDIKYSQADENPQKTYDNALEERQTIIDKTNGLNLNKEQIVAKINELKQAENNLNGQEKVKEAKENAISRINNEYISLTEAQKTKAIENINQANNFEQINQADNENKVLNGQMQTLRDYLAKGKTLKADNNYLNASPDKKQVYDQEIIKAQNLLKQLENNNDENLLNENLVNQQNQNLHNAIDNLNGNNIAETRKQVIDYINQLNDLNNKQKENLIAQVNKEVENEKILAIKDLANNINQTMQNLKNQLAKYANLATDKKYLNATSEKKLTFEDVKNQAANLVDKEKGANVIDQKTIEQLAKDLKTKYNDLDGDQLLKNKQNQAKEKIDQLTKLNNAQKEALKNEIDNVLLIADVDDIVNKAITLDNLMQQLANTLQDLENELNQENNDSYKAASPRTKNNYDKLKNQTLDLLQTNSMQNLDSQAVNQLEKI
ncbi:hypothetical protein [Mycoplasma sp. 1018B]|uniref:hypothetical protein n=1 Tax=Mycoplasma sp. 1018B TaxID=2967302 RepID=UPI00211B7540|nr:hypothetical protein [Mycoplasma sp. 1018B]UUM19444.1 hypothetical protein NPA14_01075 [Mycoplasma sp. 1018B]